MITSFKRICLSLQEKNTYTTTMRKVISILLAIVFVLAAHAQTAEDVILLKNPNTNKWGYANKQQNHKSPIKGLRKTAINILGKTGQSILASGNTNDIDWVVPPQYDAAATDFEESLAAVEVNGKVGFIDLHNRFIIEPLYLPMKHLEGFSQGLAAVRVGDRFGYIDKKGKMVIEPQFELARNFRDNMLATVKMNGKYGAIDITGKVVVECKYLAEEAMISVPISNKEYREAAKAIKAKKESDAYAAITDKLQSTSREVNSRINDSTWIQKLTYENFEVPQNDSDRKQIGARDNYGRIIVPAYYQDVKHDAANHLYVVCYSWKDEVSYGLYDDTGKRLFMTAFDAIGPFSGGKATATINGISGWIDKDGYIEPEFLEKLCDSGLQAEQAGDKRAARKIYRRILNIDSDHVMALNNMALMDIDAKDYNEGMKKLKLAHELAPDNKLIADNLAMAKHDRKDRRWNRVNSALKAVVAVVGVAASTYAVAAGGSEGIEAAGNIMQSTEETLASMNGEESALGTEGGIDDAASAEQAPLFPDMSGFSATTGTEPTANTPKNKHPESFYTDMYRRWEARAKDSYETLTRAGIRVKNKKTGDDIRGNTAGEWNSAHYASLKSNLRQAQDEMRKIRVEARSDGYTIMQSNYESVSVSY